MNGQVIVYIQAYNAEKTLGRAIESILAQTYGNFTLHVLDNGSLDATRAIIMNYADKDRRIVPMIRDINHLLDKDKTLPLLPFIEQIAHQHNGSVFFANLDADDEYVPDFLETMLAFIQENNLEAATCGTDWIDETTGKTLRHKAIDQSIILEGSGFAEQFPVYRNFAVTAWGAVYSIELLRKCDFEWSRSARYFSDTAFCLETFRRASRAGILAESLHRYYISPRAESCRYYPDWFWACKNLHRINREYLSDFGPISRQNEAYLCVLFLILIKYILPRIQNADIKLPEKLKSIDEIFNDEMTKHMLKHWTDAGIYSDKEEFLREIHDWIMAQDGWEQEKNEFLHRFNYDKIDR